MPRPFHSFAEDEDVVCRYQEVGAIGDPSEFRWGIRPSAPYAMIDLYTCDICPRIEVVRPKSPDSFERPTWQSTTYGSFWTTLRRTRSLTLSRRYA